MSSSDKNRGNLANGSPPPVGSDAYAAWLERMQRTRGRHAAITKNLAPRWFLMSDVHSSAGTVLLQPRWCLSYLRGPMTQSELRRALGKLPQLAVA